MLAVLASALDLQSQFFQLRVDGRNRGLESIDVLLQAIDLRISVRLVAGFLQGEALVLVQLHGAIVLLCDFILFLFFELVDHAVDRLFTLVKASIRTAPARAAKRTSPAF